MMGPGMFEGFFRAIAILFVVVFAVGVGCGHVVTGCPYKVRVEKEPKR